MCSTPSGPGTAQVYRLAGRLRQSVERRPRHLDDVALEHAPLGHAQNRRARSQAPALAVLLDQPAPLERADEPRRGALGKPGGRCELGQRHRLLALEHAHKQIGAAIDRGGAVSWRRVNLELLFHAV